MRLLLRLFLVATAFLICHGLDAEQPDLQIVPEPVDESDPVIKWEKVNNGAGIFSRSKSTLELFCTAAYPIQWAITGFVDPIDIVIFQPSKRILTKSREVYEIRVIVFFREEASSSAWIECQGVEDPSLFTNKIAVFVPGSHIFAENIKNSTIFLKDVIQLPCGITDPTVSVQIQLHTGKKILPVSGTYDPVDGFSLDNPVSGTYTCQANMEKLSIVLSIGNDADLINPQETPIKSFTTDNITLKCSSNEKEARFRVTGDVGVVYLENEPTLKMIQLYAKDEQEGNATCYIGNSVQYTWQYEFEVPPRVYIDNFEGEIYCLSDHYDRAVSTVHCNNPTHCDFQKRCLEVKGKCNLEQLNYFTNSRPNRCWIETEHRGANCASLAFHHLNGLVECRVGGLSTVTEFFVSLKMKRYTNWNDAPRDELIRMDPLTVHLPTRSPVSFYCEATSFLFADSLKFQLEFKNGTRRFLPDSHIKNPSREDNRKIDGFNIIGILTMKLPEKAVAVHCLAPWWNSTEYMSTTIRF